MALPVPTSSSRVNVPNVRGYTAKGDISSNTKFSPSINDTLQPSISFRNFITGAVDLSDAAKRCRFSSSSVLSDMA